MKTPVPFDESKGSILKNIGMDNVRSGANDEFVAAAYQALTKAARELQHVTTDDLMERMPDGLSTRNLKVLGPIMRSAVKQEIIIKDETLPWVPCKRPSRHHAPMQVWKSLIYRRG